MTTLKIRHDELERLRDLLVGRAVKWVEYTEAGDGRVMLDGGTWVDVRGNGGCPGCGAGDYVLETLARCPNLITNVVVERDDVEDYEAETGVHIKTVTRYRLFVIVDDDRVNLAQFVGSDGNGWYGTGFWLEVRP